MSFFTNWVWLGAALLALFGIQQLVLVELQWLCHLLLGRRQSGILLNQIVLLPGVVVHELSHWVMAKLLQVPTFGITLLPTRSPNGDWILGTVRTARTHFVNRALIGAAPLLTGGLLLFAIGQWALHLQSLGQAFLAGDLLSLSQALRQQPYTADGLFWLYLVFAIGNTMLPSASDREAWLPLAALLLLLAIAIYLLGLGDWVWLSAAQLGHQLGAIFASALSLCVLLDVILLLPLAGLVAVLQWLVPEPAVF